MDQPTGDGVNTYIVSRAVRQTGLTVALSGLGGDELFGGYPSFSRLPRAAEVGRFWGRSSDQVRGFAGRAMRLIGGTSVLATKAAAAMESDGSLAALYPLTRQLFTDEQRLSLFAPVWRSRFAHAVRSVRAPSEERLRAHARKRAGHPGVVCRVAHVHARRAAARHRSDEHGARARSPRAADRSRARRLRHGGAGSRSRRLAPRPSGCSSNRSDRALPREIVHRPKKGFTLPFEPWMRNQLRGFCESRLGGWWPRRARAVRSSIAWRACGHRFCAAGRDVTLVAPVDTGDARDVAGAA